MMTSNRCVAVIVAFAAAGPAHADGTATWLWTVTTQDADSIVEPGETASVTLSVLMELDAGNGPFIGFGAAIFDCVGDAGAYQGHILGWEIHNDLTDLTGDLTTSDGVSLYNINVGQLTNSGAFALDNPIDVITFQWAPNAYAPLDVTYDTATAYDGEHIVYIWEGKSYHHAEITPYPISEAAITFSVVPTPSTALAFAPAIFACPRRCRS